MKLPISLLMAAGCALAILSTSSIAQSTTDKPKPLASADKKFVKDVSESLFYQLRVAERAKRNALDETTKGIGEKIDSEGKKMWAELAEVAQPSGIELPADLASSEKASAERLNKAKEDKFDKLYLKEVSKDLKKLVTAFENSAKSAQAPEVKAYAEKWLPTVKSQYEEVEKAEKEVGKKK